MRFDPQKSATHLNRTDVAMVVITVKELKEPFTVLRPEEFLDNNRFPCGNILILLQKNQDHMDTYSIASFQDGA